ncbi:unnamed protein product [marine sediment metagenome]|uniref:Uncharacterized protein n=1 Tax=marine sediment metagenome TaxID=412755 RepID=X0ZMX1_9ZZZZ
MYAQYENMIVCCGQTTRYVRIDYGYHDPRSYHDTLQHVWPLSWKPCAIITDIPSDDINLDKITVVYKELYNHCHYRDPSDGNLSFKLCQVGSDSDEPNKGDFIDKSELEPIPDDLKSITYERLMELHKMLYEMRKSRNKTPKLEITEVNNEYDVWLKDFIANNSEVITKQRERDQRIQYIKQSYETITERLKEIGIEIRNEIN